MAKIECISLATMQQAAPPTESIVCLGNFDGVHLAHRKLLRLAKEIQGKKFLTASTAVFCFYSPSFDYIPGRSIGHLSTLSQKLEYFRQEGIEYAFLTDFPSVQTLSPADFTALIKTECRCAAVLCGFNYHFGFHGAGSAQDLSPLMGCPAFVQEEVCFDGKTVSSTEIRRLLTEGQVEAANELLLRPFSFTASVVHGKSLGRHLGAPTINQNLPEKMLIPRHGVYVTECEIDGKHFRGVSNIGRHPTVDGDLGVNCETHLLDFDGDLYGKEITVSFLKFIRDEKKFESQEALQLQIAHDILQARAFIK